MIRLYVASKKLVEAEKEICIKLVVPTEENNIWIALQKTEMESLDDCEISDIECDVKEADEFLKKLDFDKTDIFEMNVFAHMLLNFSKCELDNYCEKLERCKPKTLKEAIYKI